jgi:hypothetical protein
MLAVIDSPGSAQVVIWFGIMTAGVLYCVLADPRL